MMRRAVKRQSGFTLAEVLVVVVIIGILASVVLPRFFGKTDEAKIAAVQAQISNFSSALSMYSTDHGKFPTTDQGLEQLLVKDEKGKGPYLANTTKLPKDPWGNDYRYLCPGEKNPDYDLWAMGPDGVSATEDDIGNWQ